MGILQAWSGWRQYRRLPPDWRNIVIYSESGQDWHYFEPLIKCLNGELNCKTTYISSDPTDPGLEHSHDFYRKICLPQGFFLTLHFNFQKADVLVLTMMDLGNLQLKKSISPVHYIYLFHSLGSTHMVDHANSYDAYDSLFCVGPHHVRELRKRESLAALPARNLFEYGHPRLEQLLARSQARPAMAVVDGDAQEANPPPTVLIAPTWGDDSILNTCGKELIAVLLEAGYHVIVRPHYQTGILTPDVIKDLQSTFDHHAHFEYQHSMAESDSLFRSDVLVCDWSAMAMEYALGLEKPVLFIDLPRRERNPDWRDFEIEPMEISFRPLAGEVLALEDLSQAAEKISQLLTHRQAFRDRMKRLRSEWVFNIGHSVAAGAREIARLAKLKAAERQQREQQHG